MCHASSGTILFPFHFRGLCWCFHLNLTIHPNKIWRLREQMYPKLRFMLFLADQTPVISMTFQCQSDFRLSTWILCLSSSVQTSAVVSLSLSLNITFPTHTHSYSQLFWTYLCNSPSFCVRDHKTSPGGTFIPQKLSFLRERIMRVSCLGECCWLFVACVQSWSPYCSFLTPNERHSLEIEFVEHENIRNWAVLAGS